MSVERTSSSATVNEVVLTNNNINNGGTPTTSGLRQHRLMPPPNTLRPSSTPCKTSNNGSNDNKRWTLKVQLPGALTSSSPQSHLASPLVASAATSVGENDTVAPDACVCDDTTDEEAMYTFSRHAIRSTYMDKSIEAKKKVIRMLFVIVAEFFICWAPLHVLNTWYLFNPEAVYKYVGSTGVSLIQLLAYISSCCNPITYCFMNKKFRQAFLGIFNCYKFSSYWCCCTPEKMEGVNGAGMTRLGEGCGALGANNSDVSGNESTIYMGRGCRSEVMVLEAEERV